MKSLLTIVILTILLLTRMPVNAEVSYDVEYNDPAGDVQVGGDYEPSIVPGYDYLDILSIESKGSYVQQSLILEMTVQGTFKKSDLINYNFVIKDGDEAAYMVMCQNGTCIGVKMDEPNSEPDMLMVTGMDTNTLQITIPINKVNDISEFDITGEAIESQFIDDLFIMYMDEAPDFGIPGQNDTEEDSPVDPPVHITNPINRSTVFKMCNIQCTANNVDYFIENVEIQIDSISDVGWMAASSLDTWETWDYQWDTRDFKNGKHLIHCRAYSGFEYFYDSIIVFVDQESAVAPKTLTNLPTFQVGNKFRYNFNIIYNDPEMADNFDVSGSMSLEIIDITTIKLNEKDFNVYVLQINSVQEIKSGFFMYKLTLNGTCWMQTQDFAVIKESMDYRSVEQSFNEKKEYYDSKITTYDPPAAKFDFPISIGKRWQSISEENTDITSISNGETTANNHTSTITMNYQCLSVDEITVPSGKFETFSVYNSKEYDDPWRDNVTMDNVSEFSTEDYAYSIEYYSQTIGFPVKMEYYDFNRQLIYSYELTSYGSAEDDNETSTGTDNNNSSGFNLKISNYNLLIIILCLVVILIIITVLLRRRKRVKGSGFDVNTPENISGRVKEPTREDSERQNIQK